MTKNDKPAKAGDAKADDDAMPRRPRSIYDARKAAEPTETAPNQSNDTKRE